MAWCNIQNKTSLSQSWRDLTTCLSPMWRGLTIVILFSQLSSILSFIWLRKYSNIRVYIPSKETVSLVMYKLHSLPVLFTCKLIYSEQFLLYVAYLLRKYTKYYTKGLWITSKFYDIRLTQRRSPLLNILCQSHTRIFAVMVWTLHWLSHTSKVLVSCTSKWA